MTGYAILVVFGIPTLFGLTLYALDALLGWLHRRRHQRRRLDW